MAMPDWFLRALTFVPVAVLSAITLPEILVQNDAVNLSLLNPRLIAGIIAVIVAWRTKNVWATIAVGMLVLWGMQLLLGFTG
jgi:branched-subunit amino acid transport protein